MDLLDALVNARGRVAAAEALGVNYRTMMACYDSRRVSRRMRQALVDFRDAGGVGDGDGVADNGAEPLEQRVAALEEEGRGLRGLVETQASQLEELGRRVAELEERGRQPGEAGVVAEGQPGAWHPPQRGHGLPRAGVVTLEQHPDEAHAFGPAAELVAEWRELRTRDEKAGNRVDRARAGVRRWELESSMLRDFGLTLPPETEPLDEARRADHLRWRRDALVETRRQLAKAERLRLLRRALTLGLWWK